MGKDEERGLIKKKWGKGEIRWREREKGVEGQRRKIKPRKSRGDLITPLPIDLLSCDVEMTSLNR